MSAEDARVIDISPEQEIERVALPIVQTAKMAKVVDSETMNAADTLQIAIKDMIKKIDALFEPMAQKAFAAHREITGKWKAMKAPLEEADKYLKGEVKGYLRKLEEERIAEQRRLEEEARRTAEEERLAQAEAAEKAGDIELAEELIAEPVVVHTPVVHIEAPRVDNRKYRTVWKAQVVDRTAFILFIADMLRKSQELTKQGRRAEAGIYAEYVDALDVKQSWIDSKSRALGGKTNLPGIRPYET